MLSDLVTCEDVVGAELELTLYYKVHRVPEKLFHDHLGHVSHAGLLVHVHQMLQSRRVLLSGQVDKQGPVNMVDEPASERNLVLAASCETISSYL